MPYVVQTNPMLKADEPKTSMCVVADRSDFGNRIAIAMMVTITTGTLIRKIHPHQKCSNNQPPMMGPSGRESMVPTSSMVIALERPKNQFLAPESITEQPCRHHERGNHQCIRVLRRSSWRRIGCRRQARVTSLQIQSKPNHVTALDSVLIDGLVVMMSEKISIHTDDAKTTFLIQGQLADAGVPCSQLNRFISH